MLIEHSLGASLPLLRANILDSVVMQQVEVDSFRLHDFIRVEDAKRSNVVTKQGSSQVKVLYSLGTGIQTDFSNTILLKIPLAAFS